MGYNHYEPHPHHNQGMPIDHSHEDIRVIDDEISELQEYNAKVESEMLKLKLDINHMEEQVKSSERVTSFHTQIKNRFSSKILFITV